MRRTVVALAVIALSLASAARACVLCSGGGNSQTLRQQAATAKLILYGTLANPRLGAAAPGGGAGGGTTDLVIERVLKSDPFLAGRKVVTINRYVPVDPKAPPKFLLFCDVFNGQLDAYAGVPVKSPALVEYLNEALAIDPKDRVKSLQQAFRYLDSPDADVAADEFVKRYLDLGVLIRDAVSRYNDEVKHGAFPGPEHSFSAEKEKAPPLLQLYSSVK